MTDMESAIGIIGGADGPTVIFVTGDVRGLIVTAAVIIGAAAGVILWMRRRKKHQA